MKMRNLATKNGPKVFVELRRISSDAGNSPASLRRALYGLDGGEFTRRSPNTFGPFFVIVFVICHLLFGFTLWASPKPAYVWNLLSDGVLYTKYSFSQGEEGWTTIHAFQIDPAKVRLDVVTADPNETLGTTVQTLAEKQMAAVVINGGFFTEARKSIGLLVQSGKTINPMHKTSWWSVFGLKDNLPFIVTPKEFRSSSDISMAVQAGPRLVIGGSIPRLRQGDAARSAVGITKDNKIIFVVTQGSPISLDTLAHRMVGVSFEGGFECPNAMALDGGASTQIFAKIKGFKLSLEGLSNITNGLAVFLK